MAFIIEKHRANGTWEHVVVPECKGEFGRFKPAVTAAQKYRTACLPVSPTVRIRNLDTGKTHEVPWRNL